MNESSKPRLKAVPEMPDPWIARERAGASLLIFLDFDGVLHPLGPLAKRFSNAAALGDALDALERDGIDSAVALTTTWRFHPWEMIQSEIALRSPSLAARLEGRCGSLGALDPEIDLAGKRRDEALAYIDARSARPTFVAALDDQPRLFGCPAPSWLIACDPKSGFGPEQEKALRLLASRPLWITKPR